MRRALPSRDRATRAVVQAALEEARARGDAYVGTEHLLLGVLSVPSPACGVLGAAGLDLATGRRALTELDAEALAAVGLDASGVELAPLPSRRGRLPLTTGARAALARRNERRLTPEQLLLALAAGRAPDVAALVLSRAGIEEADLQARLEAPWRRAG
jgi:ATP-dependent Clp protease ATP-binding subunit ClpA